MEGAPRDRLLQSMVFVKEGHSRAQSWPEGPKAKIPLVFLIAMQSFDRIIEPQFEAGWWHAIYSSFDRIIELFWSNSYFHQIKNTLVLFPPLVFNKSTLLHASRTKFHLTYQDQAILGNFI